MHPSFDPAASLRLWAVEAEVGGHLLRIEALPAADWLPPLMQGTVMAVRDLVVDFPLRPALLDGDFTLGELRDGLTVLVEAAAGRSVTAALTIAVAAGDRWDVIGADVARAGVAFDRISLGAALDALYASILRHLDEKGQAAFIRTLLDTVEATPIRAPKGAKPLPASAEQYVRTRPKTRLRRPPPPPDVQPAPPTAIPGRRAGNARPSRTGLRMPDAGGGNPQSG